MDQPLPLFPLRTVLFPGMLLPLHVFEPRYRLLVRRSLDGELPFGVVLIRSGAEVGPGTEPHRVGTTARIVAHLPLADGRSYIVVRGERRFAIEAIEPDAEPYLVARARYLPEPEGEDAAHAAARAATAYGEYLLAAQAVTEEAEPDAPSEAELHEGSPADVAYRVAAGLALEADERQRLLEASTARERI
ncbi:MAG TPA: LON peptidase substrate-binding domain-containing protein, partial [Candidatus Limnocylindrales bacterium]|nr:LON peptidase substrate-binding domain-containing protein [Candidatus Limnocylindrales bacterium]